MFLRCFSDLHLEFSPFTIPPLDTDNDTVCILAGDIVDGHNYDMCIEFLKPLAQRFHHIVYVFGNHEFYNKVLEDAKEEFEELLLKANLAHKVTILEREVINFNKCAIIGATLWADFDRGNPVTMHACLHGLDDYRKIETVKDGSPRKIVPTDLLVIHNETRQFLRQTIENYKAINSKVIVVVHHGVTSLSQNPIYRGDILVPAFISNMADDILDTQPNMIIHGHIHYHHDYMVGDTRVFCNPRGYHGYERVANFKPCLAIEI